MKLLILGHGRHGKDTVAEMISTLYGLKFSSSSRAALKAIFPALRALYNFDIADTNEAMEAAYNERHQHREVWKALISLYNAHDKSALCRLILEENDMYVGMRCEKEYKACKHLFDAVIYVQADVFVTFS